MTTHSTDIAIIGAGPAGAVAAALLNKQGFSVTVLEKQHFPRFVIGESLLPHCMEFIEEAGFLDAVQAAPAFQFKNGAAFTWGSRYTDFDFTDKFTAGPGTTFQVRRAQFDQLLIEEARKQGVEVRFGHSVVAFNNDEAVANITVKTDTQETYPLQARFVLDASGYGRVLPRLLNLDTPSHLPMREAHFTHIQDNINDSQFDRNKILISTHSAHRDIWLWLIPFGDNHCSIGVVGLPKHFQNIKDTETIIKKFASEIPMLKRILANAVWGNFPYRAIQGYSANVSTLHGKHFALLGNAAEFLDPVFSSGVTIAMHSAKMAADLLSQQLRGATIDWQKSFTEPLMIGVNTFRTYVEGWYDGSFQDVIYSTRDNVEVRRMISAILSGYAWDTQNPFVAKSQRRLAALAETVGKIEYQ